MQNCLQQPLEYSESKIQKIDMLKYESITKKVYCTKNIFVN